MAKFPSEITQARIGAFGQSSLFQGLIRRGQRELFAESQVDIGNVVDGQIMFPSQGFQRNVVEPFSAYNPDRQGCPDFRHNRIGLFDLLKDRAVVRRVFGRIVGKTPRDGYGRIENERSRQKR